MPPLTIDIPMAAKNGIVTITSPLNTLLIGNRLNIVEKIEAAAVKVTASIPYATPPLINAVIDNITEKAQTNPTLARIALL